MAVGRRGAVFTLMAVVLALLLLSSERSLRQPLTPLQTETIAADTRASVMSAYAATFEQHAAQALATAGHFTLRNMSARVRQDGAFFSPPSWDVNTTVRSCIINGTISVGNELQTCVPAQHNVQAALTQLKGLASTELSVTTDFYVEDVWVTEEHPLEVLFWMQLDYNVSDVFASWQHEDVIIRAPVDVSGVPDPVYAYLAADGRTTEVRNFSLTTIRRNQFTPAMFNAFYANYTYIFLDNRSPSVLQRYAGNTTGTSACCGVESVLDLSQLVRQDEYVNYSLTDHQFASHVRDSLLPRFNCYELQVKSRDQGGHLLVLDAWHFDSLYNITPSLPACTDIY